MFYLFFGDTAKHETITLGKLRECKGIIKRNPGLTGMEHGPGTPTEDEGYLMDRFKVHLECQDTAESAIKCAVRDLEIRFEERKKKIKVNLGNLSAEDKALGFLAADGYTIIVLDQNGIQGTVLFKRTGAHTDAELLEEALDYLKSALGGA